MGIIIVVYFQSNAVSPLSLYYVADLYNYNIHGKILVEVYKPQYLFVIKKVDFFCINNLYCWAFHSVTTSQSYHNYRRGHFFVSARFPKKEMHDSDSNFPWNTWADVLFIAMSNSTVHSLIQGRYTINSPWPSVK